MSFPLTPAGLVAHTDGQQPSPLAEATAPAGIALAADHPLVITGWLLAALVLAVGLGPWLSKCAGIMLPAFALVRTKG